MEQEQAVKSVHVAKGIDRIPVQMPEDQVEVGKKLDLLCSEHGEGSVFVDGKSVADHRAEAKAAAAKYLADEAADKQTAEDVIVNGDETAVSNG